MIAYISKPLIIITILFLLLADSTNLFSVEPEKATDLKGREVPLFILRDIDGNRFKMEDRLGKVMVVNFFYIACKSCTKELPMLNKLSQEFSSDDFELVIINGLKEDKPSNIKEFLKSIKIEDLRVIKDNLGIQVKRFKVDKYPVSFLVNKQGVIVEVYEGFPKEMKKKLRKEIKRLIKGRE